MKNYSLFVISLVALILSTASAAYARNASDASDASDIGISFELRPSPADLVPEVKAASEPEADAPADDWQAEIKPLQIPSGATSIPVGKDDRTLTEAELPPPPIRAIAPVLAATPSVAPAPQPAPPAVAPTPQPPVELSFESAAVAAAVTAAVADAQPDPVPSSPEAAALPTADQPGVEMTLSLAELESLFRGDTNSLVARAVGSAEGTRTPDGGRTSAYQGHVDPGNGVWNLGTFSYQHGAASPEEADQKQMDRLKLQAQTLRQQAASHQLTLSLEEELNGIDLANQSPRAALSRGGYIERLKQAQEMGLVGSEAVLWARTRSYLDPDTSRWNAPGLGNTVQSITRDQERRQEAIARAMAVTTPPESGPLPPTLPAPAAAEPPEPPLAAAQDQPAPAGNDLPDAARRRDEAIVDQILFLDLSP